MLIAPFIYFYETKTNEELNANAILIDGPEKLLIDPGFKGKWPVLKQKLLEDGHRPEQIKMVFCTHSHPDHSGAAEILQKEFGAAVAMGRQETRFLAGPGLIFFSRFGQDKPDFIVDQLLDEGQFNFGGHSFELYHTPGHSPGGFCLFWPKAGLLVAGDIYLNGTTGATRFFGGSQAAMAESIRRLQRVSGVQLILCGHGPALIGAEAIEANYRVLNFEINIKEHLGIGY